MVRVGRELLPAPTLIPNPNPTPTPTPTQENWEPKSANVLAIAEELFDEAMARLGLGFGVGFWLGFWLG